jgi:hypothetical protein
VKIIQTNDRYIVSWHAHISKALTAKYWCHDTFSDSWGEAKLGVPNGIGIGKHVFYFHRLSHANWFILKNGSF